MTYHVLTAAGILVYSGTWRDCKGYVAFGSRDRELTIVPQKGTQC